MALLTTTGDIAVNLQGYYDRNLLERATAAILFDKFGQMRPMPSNSGTKINFRRFESLPVNTTALTDGVTPTGKQLSATDINATVKQYGDFVTITDWIDMVGLDKNLLEIGGEVLAEMAALAYDTLCRDVLAAGTNVKYEGAATSTATVDGPILDADINYVIRLLEGNNAKKIRDIKTGSSKVGTSPIAASYIAITHPDCRYDIENLTGFTPTHEYANQDELSKAEGEVVEIGAVKGIRFLSTTNAKVTEAGGAVVGATGMKAADSTNIDVYSTIVLAKNAYGMVPLGKKNIQNIVKKMGSAGTDDPLNQRATSGYKFATTFKILNDDFLCRIEHAVTSL